MTIDSPRVAKLRRLVDEAGGPAAFAKRYSQRDADKPIDETYVSQILNGHRTFGEKAALNMARRAGLPKQYFNEAANTALGPEIHGRVPLISWVRAGDWCAVTDNIPLSEAEEFYQTTAKVGQNAYALRVNGDSMETKFPDGCVIIVDPTREARHGSFVVVLESGSAEATFKQLQIDGSRQYLKPLNPRYPIMELREETQICGVVVKMEMDV
ncbi:MAG: S24 family peptidase [Betaproteobacteria bacterium]|nr:S24 family peptidase [Betaproteobacteria bacterium]